MLLAFSFVCCCCCRSRCALRNLLFQVLRSFPRPSLRSTIHVSRRGCCVRRTKASPLDPNAPALQWLTLAEPELSQLSSIQLFDADRRGFRFAVRGHGERVGEIAPEAIVLLGV